MYGQAVITGTRAPVSAILDCIAVGLTTEQITAEYPTLTAAGVRAAAAYGAALAREELLPIPQSRVTACGMLRGRNAIPPGRRMWRVLADPDGHCNGWLVRPGWLARGEGVGISPGL
jgi:uncharacterized protein (DUF433 family)